MFHNFTPTRPKQRTKSTDVSLLSDYVILNRCLLLLSFILLAFSLKANDAKDIEKRKTFFQQAYIQLKKETASFLKEGTIVSNIKLNKFLHQEAATSMASSSCNCTNYLYVNDPTLDLTHKFELNSDGSVGSEIGSTWVDAEVINNPHGVVADLNGNLYISQINQGGDEAVNRLFKLDCDGNVIDNNFIPDWLYSYNLTSIGNTLYAVGQNPTHFGFEVVSYDLCTKALINTLTLPNNIASWGLTLGKDENLYITSSWAGFGGNHTIYRVDSDLNAYTPMATINNTDANNYALGVAQDEHLNWFMVTFHAQTGATTIYKINSSGNLVHSITDSTLDQVGFGGAWGITYSEDVGKLYVGTLADDCVAVINAGGASGNLAYIPNEGIAHVPATYSKAINILKECCPTNNNLVVDTTLCVSAINEVLFLQDLINCEGTICEGVWQEGGGNTGLTYNSCNNSITINSLEACGTFSLNSDGTGNNPLCGAFTITVNIEVATVTAPVIAGNQTVCQDEVPVAFTLTTPATGEGTITYQWQSSTTSCEAGFTDIVSEINPTYTPPADLSETTYYRIVTTNTASCSSGNCEALSNCLTVIVDNDCDPCDLTLNPGMDVTPDCSAGIAGMVYKDLNFDGINNDNQGGFGGIEVSAYDCDGNLVGSSTTDAEGEYQISGTTTGETYRIEFHLPEQITCYAQPTFLDGANSLVQFQEAGTCIDLGLYDSNDCLNPIFNMGSDSHYDGKLFADGMGFVTCGTLVQSDPNERYTFGVFDIRSLTFGNDRPLNNLGDYHHPSWRVDSIGNVFGLTIDNNKNIYATASSHYGAGYGYIGSTSPAVVRYGEIGGGSSDLGAAGTIYKIDAYTGQATVFAQLPQLATSLTNINCEGSETVVRNTGPALGNIDFDSLHNQFFVTNFEDGKIYRIGADGTTLSTFDPFDADSGAAGIATDKKPYGVTVNLTHDKVFFGTLNFDLDPELYSIDLDANGEFTGVPQLHTSLQGNGEIGGPFVNDNWVAISDLEFTPEGTIVAGIRTGCFNLLGSSHNHGGTYHIMESTGGDGIFDDLHDNPRIHYIADGNGPDDGYGGVGIWKKEDGTFDYLISSADIIQEDGPHGLLIFPHDYTTTGNNSNEYILRPAATISYLPSYDGTSGPGEDFKGIGGDVVALSACDPLPLEIGNYVWEDTDADGIQDACEKGLANVIIRLYSEDCLLIGLDTTDLKGHYTFNFSNVDTTGLNADGSPVTHFNALNANTQYYIVLGAEGDWDATKNKLTANQEVYNLTLSNVGVKDNIDSDAIEGVGCGHSEAPVVSIVTGEFGAIDHKSDFGLIPTLSLGNLVWEDLNNNGLAEMTEPGIENVELILFNIGIDGIKNSGDDIALDTVLTDNAGNYTFKGLDSGTFYIKISDGIPAGMTSSTGTGKNGTDASTYEPGAVTNNDINNNDDGSQMNSMIMSDTVQLVNLMEPTNDGDLDSLTNFSVDFGLIRLLSIGNLVWEDENNDGLNNNNESGIDDITVYLLDDGADDTKGNSDDNIIDSVITAAGGQYLFDSLSPGEYYVKLNSGIPVGMISSTAKENNTLNTEPASDPDSDDLNDDDNGTQMGTMVMSELVSLTLSDEPTDDGDVDSTSNLAVDFGLFTPLSIGNLVWKDDNNNGQFDSGMESGVEDVELILFSVGADGVKGGGNDIQIAIDTTDVNGNYLFDTLISGTYYVKINSGIPEGLISSTGSGKEGGGTSTYEPSTITDTNVNNDDDGTQMGSMIMSDTLNLAKNTEPTNDDDTDNNTNLSVDFGLIPMLSLGNLVWTDTNNDGLNNNGETGIDNIKVQLFTAGDDDTKGTDDDVLLDSMITTGGGLYEFDSLAPGDYFVKLTDLKPGLISSTGEGTNTITGAGTFEPAADPDDTDTNDDDSGTQMSTMVMSDLVSLVINQEPINDGDTDATSNLSIDFGLLQTMSVGNLVWEDDNNNGQFDSGTEEGIENVEVVLFGLGPDGLKGTIDDIEIKKDTTDANGQYLFELVSEGTYYVKLNDGIPTDMYSSTGTGVDGSAASTYEPFTGTDLNINNNDDGTQMIVGNTLMIMSDTFQVAPNTEPTNDEDADNNTNLSIDFGLIPLMSIGNLVWEDIDNNGINNDEPGIDGIEVMLFDPVNGVKGDGDDIILDVTMTMGGGLFLFDSLHPGDYYIKLNSGIPTGMISATGEGVLTITGSGSAEPANDPDLTDTNNDDSGTQMGTMVMSDIVTLNLNNEPITDGDTDNNSNLAVDFGLFQTLSIGNLVWEDLNNDGQFDNGTESGVEDIVLTLYTLGPDGIKGNSDDIEIATDTTNTNGNYLFEYLAAATYYVKINSGILTGYVSSNGAGTTGNSTPNYEPGATTNNDANNDDDGTQMGTMIMSDTIQLVKNTEPTNDEDADNNTNLSVDFGIIPAMSLGNLVWEDLDNDGQAEAGEPGIDGITVYLLNDGTDDIKGNSDDKILDSIITTSGGQYLFDSLYPGEYYIKLNSGIPADLISSTGEGDSTATGTGAYETAPNPDATELNNDDNGTQMGTMIMSDLVSMVLYDEPVNDGDADSTTNYNVDFGLFHTLTLGNLVWEDTNNDGLNNNGELGIENIEVILFTAGEDGIKGNGDDVAIATDTTDATGYYLFEDLLPNEYFVKLNDIPTGMISSTAKENINLNTEPGLDANAIETDNDDNGSQMDTMVMSELIQLSLGEEPITDTDTDSTTNLSVDFGLFVPLSIGNLVWEDLDNDGQAEEDEAGIEGVEVILYAVGSDGVKGGGDDVAIAIDTTDATGHYLFDTLIAGTYYVKLNSGIPANMYSTTGTGFDGSNPVTYEPGAMTDSNTNNDDDGTQMMTNGQLMVMSDTVNLFKFTEPTDDEDADNRSNLSVDFGLIRLLSVGNLVWEDSNNDGLFNNEETGIDSIEVILYQAGADEQKGTSDDIGIDTVLTDVNGAYLFDTLYPGEYFVKLNGGLLSGMISSTGEGTPVINGAGTYEPGVNADTDSTNNDDNGTQMGSGATTMVMSDIVLLSLSDEPTNDGDVDSTSNLTVDFGILQTMSVGNLVFEDLDNSGTADAGEPGIEGVEMILYELGPDGEKGTNDDIEIKRDTTDADGYYLFEYVTQGTYFVKINSGTPTDMYSSTGTGEDGTNDNTSEPFIGTDENVDNNDDGTQMIIGNQLMVMSDTFQIQSYTEPTDDSDTDNNTNLSIDFGLIRLLSIGNLVWEDNDNDGLNNNGEVGIDGIEVQLLQAGTDNIKGTSDDVLLETMLTANGGKYLFDTLYPGDYFIKLNDGIPSGMHSSTGEGTGIFTGSGTVEPAADPDNTDTNDDDSGTQMGTPTMRMVMSELVTLSLSDESITDGDVDSTSNLAVDFGLYQTISVGNLVWEDLNNDGTVDSNEPGVDSVEVQIYNIGPDGEKGTTDDLLVQIDTTDINGAYNFTFLGQGTYYVKLINLTYTTLVSSNGAGTLGKDPVTFEPGAMTDNDADNDDDGSQMGAMVMSDTFQLVKNMEPITDSDLDSNTNFTIDFGLVQPLELGNLVWEDLNNNGTVDEGEPGIDGVEVMLYWDGNDGIKGNENDTLITSMLTANGGKYLFDNLYPGEYYLKLNQGIPTHFISSSGEGVDIVSGAGTYETAPDPDAMEVDNDDNGTQMGIGDTAMIMSDLVSLEIYNEPKNDGDTLNTTNYNVDFGLYHTLTIGNLVWEDLNNNGTVDSDESGMEGVEVVLYQPGPDGIKGTPDDIQIAKDTTDTNGNYLFEDLYPNNYYLVLESGLPSNMVSSTGEGDIVAAGTGAYETAPDPDNNINNDDDGTGMQVGSNMLIMSDILSLGLYDEPTNDGDVDSTTNLTVDFSLFETMSIGNLVWEDLNNNGFADASEPKMGDIVVTLFKDGGDGIKMSADDINMGNDTTDSNGHYLFDNLYPGEYYLKIIDLPHGMISSTGEGINSTTTNGTYEPAPDADINTDNLDDGIFMDSMIMSTMVSLNLYDEPINDGDTKNNTNLSIDFGLFQTLILGNLVWEDLNNNGLAEENEPGMEGIEVTLFRDYDGTKGGNDDVEISKDTTDENGNYLFANLDAGMYYIKLSDGIPSGFMSSTGEGTGYITGEGPYEPAPDADVYMDMDDNGTQMNMPDGSIMVMSELISMVLYNEQTDSIVNMDVDFGLYNTLEAGNLVWEDLNNNGLVDAGEPGIEGVEVILYQTTDDTKANGDDVEIGRDTTDADGMYIFQTLEPGDYWVKLNSGIPTGFYSSTGEGITTVTGEGIFEPASMVDDNIDDNDDGTQMGLGDNIMVMSDIVSLDLYDEPDSDGTFDSTANYRIDFGLYETIDLGNLVWEDYDNDGMKDPEEPGFPNITVALSKPGPDGLAGTNDDIEMGIDTTDENGAYLFEYLNPNEYFITISNIPEGFNSSSGEGFMNADGTGTNEPAPDPDNDINNDDDGTEGYLADGTKIVRSDIFSLVLYTESTTDEDTDNTTNFAVDFGLYESLEIGNLVWEDLNNNGLVDAGEEGMENIEAVLFKAGPDGQKGTSDDLEIGRDTTDNNGAYEFIDLYPGEYFVQLNSGIPAHFASSTGEGTILADGTGTTEPAADPDGDINDNDDGTQMGNPDGSLIVTSDLVSLHLYNEPLNDGDVDSTTNFDVDFGLFELLSIGNNVWEDYNNNGHIDEGEPSIENIEVVLYKDGGDEQTHSGDDIEIARMVTDSTGAYRFDDLYPGDYFVHLANNIPYNMVSATGEGIYLVTGSGSYESPETPEDDIDHDDSGLQTGTTVSTRLVSLELYNEPTNDGDASTSTNFDVDFGLIRKIDLGGTVWFDRTNDGDIGVGEHSMEDIEVVLNKPGEDGMIGTTDDICIDTMMTDSVGKYLFTSIFPDVYYLRLQNVPSWVASSDGNGFGAYTGVGPLEEGGMSDMTDSDDNGVQVDKTTIVSDLFDLILYQEPMDDDDDLNYTNTSLDFALTPLHYARIFDPCNCLSNESAPSAGDGQFEETITILSTVGNQTWSLVSNTRMYTTNNELVPLGTVAVPNGMENNYFKYELRIRHYDNQGYSAVFKSTNGELMVSNFCQYDGSCRYDLATSPDGTPGAPQLSNAHNFITAVTNTPRIDTMLNCDDKSRFMDDGLVDGLYTDTTARDNQHTICPQNQWQRLTFTFTEFGTAAGDILYVHDGASIAAPLIGEYEGEGVSQTNGWVAAHCDPDTNATGCLTFRFVTNGDNNKSNGWHANIACNDREIVLTPPNNLNANLTCDETYAVLDIKPATVMAACGTIQDSQIVRVFNAHGNLCLDTCVANTDVIKDTFGLGAYRVEYKLKSDTVKTTEGIMTVQGAALVCNDKINVPLGSACSIVLTPDDLLETACDTITDTMYYQITLNGVDKNGQSTILATGGGKGGNYPSVTKDMIEQCGGTITATIEKRYYDGLNLTFCNNGPQNASCEVTVNLLDQTPPVFTNISTSADTFRLCSVDLTADALGIAAPTAIDNCDTVSVEFVDAAILNDGGPCDTTRATLNWKATDVCGNVTTLAQSVVILRPQFTDIVKPTDIVLSCGEDGENTLNDISKTGKPGIKVGKVVNGILIPTDTIALDTADYVCGYILQKKDVSIPADCGTKLFRYWEILDWCSTPTGVMHICTQQIELKDTLAPTFVENTLPTRIIDLPHDACTLDITKLDNPAAIDNCSAVSVSMNAVFRIENGTNWQIEASELTTLDCDSFLVQWIAEDACHEQLKNDTITQLVLIEDNTAPSAACVDKINLSLGQNEAKIHYTDIDGGSYDACGISKYEVSRDEVNWDSTVTFDCNDAHVAATVYLRVTDGKGNQSTCWMTVNVEDKIAPICSDLPDMTGTCEEEHLADLGVSTDANENGLLDDEWVDLSETQIELFNTKYGNPNCSDNIACGGLVVQQQYQLANQKCGQIAIQRRFRAIDWDGKGRTSNWSTQNINIEAEAAWSITLPSDWKGTCGENIPNSDVFITNGNCDLLAHEVEEKVFTITEDACLKVVRTFTIINWCNYESGQPTVTITRDENEHGLVKHPRIITAEAFANAGKLEYIQILKLQDDIAPVITIGSVDNCIDSEGCNETKRFAITANDCNIAATIDLVYNWSISTNGIQLAASEGSFFEYEVAPNVTYEVNWTVADNCGNIAKETVAYEFKDCKKPAPYCLNGTAVELMSIHTDSSLAGMIQVWATDFERGSSDNCTPVDRLAYRVWHASMGDAPTDLAGVQALPEVITFDCATIGQQNVNLYAIDEAGNWDFCTTYILVQDNMNACENTGTTGMAVVSGSIRDWKGKTVEEVQVQVSNLSSMITQADGFFNFELAMNNPYTIQPEKNGQPLNGVTTFDLVLISKHILGITEFDNPYQMIAADVNGSGSITAFDIVQIRQLILNIKTAFTNNKNWRFVDAAYEFASDSPMTEGFNEIIQIEDLQHDMEMDFVAIKIGDVNGSAQPNSLAQAEDRTTTNTFEITTEDKVLKAGEIYSLAFSTEQLATVQGYQFTLGYENLKLEQLNSGVAGVENFGLHKMDEGMITTSWNQSVDSQQYAEGSEQYAEGSEQPSTVLFNIEFTALKDGKLSEQLSLLNRPTAIEAYSAGTRLGETEGELMDVQLTFTTPLSDDKFELFQNQPNPFHDRTMIGFYLPGDSEVQLILRDETGRVLKTYKEDRKGGYNTIQLEKEELTNGFIYYQLSTKFGTKAKKMLQLK